MRTIPTIGFVDAIRQTASKLTDFKGRSRRSEYWWTALAVGVVNFIIGLFPPDYIGVALLVSLLTWLLMIPLSFRRLHDTGRSGWWYGASIILYVLFYIYLIAEVLSLGLTSMDLVSMNMDADMRIWLMPFVTKLLLWLLVIFIYGIVLLVFMCMDSERGTNKYGPSPKYVEEEEGVTA